MKTLIATILTTSIFAFGFKATPTKYFTREANITFLSDAPLEKIQGINNQAVSMLDISTGAMEFAVLMKAFEFEKALLQEHFNENYVESDKFPKANFKGTITNFADVKWTEDREYPVTVTGKLTIHGVTKDVTSKGKIIIKTGAISANSTFNILISDYNIEIPSVVKNKINNSVKIDVNSNYKPYEG
ncbi:hypothetical protein LBMAG27_13980 [Bacteroidota bacterium]|nr:hypothetical protein LBMAG27_13980 [Bacteroidota bacterium]